jgi:hypothetical protein
LCRVLRRRRDLTAAVGEQPGEAFAHEHRVVGDDYSRGICVLIRTPSADGSVVMVASSEARRSSRSLGAAPHAEVAALDAWFGDDGDEAETL